ncbi:MAG TPA: hypothetical protein VFV73_22430 [Streptosporangiaceae bacterium]|nr:hypothetical protein [Streptosporangiaceae bacterium]
MYTGKLIYQAERPLSRAEQQQVDIANAELVRAVSRCWHALAAPLRALRAAGRPTRRQASYGVAEYPAAERLTECQAGYQAGECLPGRAA